MTFSRQSFWCIDTEHVNIRSWNKYCKLCRPNLHFIIWLIVCNFYYILLSDDWCPLHFCVAGQNGKRGSPHKAAMLFFESWIWERNVASTNHKFVKQVPVKQITCIIFASRIWTGLRTELTCRVKAVTFLHFNILCTAGRMTIEQGVPVWQIRVVQFHLWPAMSIIPLAKRWKSVPMLL